MLYVITPCSRPYNLPEMYNSIPKQAHWIICHDNPEGVPRYPNTTTLMCSKNGVAGSKAINHVYDNFPFKNEDWLYILDDDNIIHEKWYQSIEFALPFDDFAMVTWGQLDNNGRSRLKATVTPKVAQIDTACFMVKYKYAKGVKRLETYSQDGLYAEECAKRGPVLAIGKYLSHYNKLEFIPNQLST